MLITSPPFLIPNKKGWGRNIIRINNGYPQRYLAMPAQ